MKIRRVNVKSFGQISNWNSGELSDNLNVIYGPNESGKSTITEFVRSTFFPKGRKTYPAQKKSDSGMIEVVMENGDVRTYEREYKTVTESNGKRSVSEEFNSMDADTYRSLYGLDLELLNKSDAISSSEMKGKYMTIPGGEGIPAVSDYIDKEIEKYITPGRITQNKIIGSYAANIENAEGRLAELEKSMGQYNELVKEREGLKANVESSKKLIELNNNKKAVRALQKSQEENLNRYQELRKSVNELEKYKDFNLEDKARYLALKKEIEEIQGKLPISGMKEKDLKAILSKEKEIETAWTNKPEYEHKKGEIDRLKESADRCDEKIKDIENTTGWSLEKAKNTNLDDRIISKAESVARNRKGDRYGGKAGGKKTVPIALAVLGLICAVLGAVFVGNNALVGAILLVLGIIALIAGVAKLVMDSKKAGSGKNEFLIDWGEWISAEGYPADISPEETIVLVTKLRRMVEYDSEKTSYMAQIGDAKATVSLYEKTVEPLIKALKIEGDDISDCVTKLHAVLADAKNEEAKESQIRTLVSEMESKKAESSKMLKKYGGETEFLRVAECKEKYDKSYADMDTLKNSIESTVNMQIDDLITVLNDPDQSFVDDIEDNTDAWNQRIGEITTMLDNIMKDGEYDRAQSERTMYRELYRNAVKEWATLSLAQSLIRDSCNRFYSDLQPDVVKAANSFLSMMTEGKYKLDSDPREKKLTIVDVNGYKKSADEWSSGLGDQVYLSVKMALAKEIGSEKMPLILDDILVRFDIDRKQGACKAIYQCAKDTQIIMFTCDKTLLNFFKLEGEYKEITI